jgi:hypothetical protein
MQMAVTGYVKIGRSCNVPRRLKQLQTGCPHTIRLLLCIPGGASRERELHERLWSYKTRGQKSEWFTEDCLGDLPVDIYEQVPVELLETSYWWKKTT